MHYLRAAALAAVAGCLAVGTAGAASTAAGKVAFASDRSGTSQIYLMESDGSAQARLTFSGAWDLGPSWAPDGQTILFDSDEAGGIDLYTVRPDGTERTQLTTSGNAYAGAYSPDGAKIVFEGIANGGSNDIFVMSAGGSDIVNVTNDPADDEMASWSPDGDTLLFDSSRDGDYDVYVMGSDGSAVAPLTANDANDTLAAWSPDGSKIAFSSDRTGAWEVFSMNADGTNQLQLTFGAGATAPAWSPDGTRIYFQGATADGSDVFAMNADGSGIVNLTNTPGADDSPRPQPVVAPTPGYAFAGFFKPVDNQPVVNVMNAGRAIPVKFSLGGDFGLGVLADGYPKSQQVTCDASAPVSSIEETVSVSASSLTYDAATDTYAYVWKSSSSWSDTCRQLVVALDDGSVHRLDFRFR